MRFTEEELNKIDERTEKAKAIAPPATLEQREALAVVKTLTKEVRRVYTILDQASLALEARDFGSARVILKRDKEDTQDAKTQKHT